MKYIVLFLKKTARILLKPLSFIPALVMMYVIFYMSAQPGDESSGLSFEVSRLLAIGYDKITGKQMSYDKLLEFIVFIHPYVRKAAHMTEYFLLAMCVGLPLYVYRIRGLKLMLLTALICVSYAALDEYHQTFVYGRCGTYKDVLIDSVGVFIGSITVRIFGSIGRNTIFKPLTLDDYEVVKR